MATARERLQQALQGDWLGRMLDTERGVRMTLHTSDQTQSRNACYPHPRWHPTGTVLGDTCPECGHSNVLHGGTRACVGCELLELSKESE